MKPVFFEESNRTLGPPIGKENEVEPLHVFTDGKQCISKWLLSDEEVEMIIKSRHLFISVMFGEVQPPILPMVKSPFIQTSEYILVIGGPDGLFINGRQVFAKEQVDNGTWKQGWGVNSPISNWVARRILMISLGDETVCNALDTKFRETFLDSVKCGESFNFMIDMKRFIKDAMEGNVQPSGTYFITAL